jgi:cell division protein ZapA
MAEEGKRAAVTVRIGGEDHVIRANVEPDYTKRCAKLVDDRITEIKSHLGLIEGYKAAILAALSITDELFQARAQLNDVVRTTVNRAEALAEKLEKATENGPEM